jgi:TRAP transporter TAXI family solute receptor
MKKLLSVLAIVALLATPLFANGSSEASGSAPAALPKTMFATHEVGTSNYNLSTEFSKLWEDEKVAQVDVQPISPGGMGAPYLFQNPDVGMTFINGAPAKWAKEKGTLGKGPASGYLAMIGSLSSVSAVNFMTKSFMKKYNCTGIEDAFRKKLPIRIGCSPVGSMDNQVVVLLMEYMGVTEDDLKSWGGSIVHAGGSQLADMVKDNRLDYMLDHTSSASSTMTEIALTCDVQFLQWEDATVDWFVNKQGFQHVTLPAGCFHGLDKDIVNPGTPDCIFVSEKLSDDLVYSLTKCLCENRDKLVAEDASLAPFDPKTCWEPERNGGIALHPGAARYYKEKGYMK